MGHMHLQNYLNNLGFDWDNGTILLDFRDGEPVISVGKDHPALNRWYSNKGPGGECPRLYGSDPSGIYLINYSQPGYIGGLYEVVKFPFDVTPYLSGDVEIPIIGEESDRESDDAG